MLVSRICSRCRADGCLSCVVSSLALAQARARHKPFEPSVGQPGKDVVWVPTPQALVEKMLDLAKVTPQDFLMDLGSGDGRTVITAAKRGLKAQGIEYNPDMVELSKRNATAAGVSDKATFVKADLFETDFSKAQVITMFLLPSINLRLRPTILNMKPGTRIVSNSFTMDDWQADDDRHGGRRLHELVHRLPVDRAGEGRGHLAARHQHAHPHPGVPGARRHPGLDADHATARLTGEASRFAANGAHLHGHGERQLDEGHHRAPARAGAPRR